MQLLSHHRRYVRPMLVSEHRGDWGGAVAVDLRRADKQNYVAHYSPRWRDYRCSQGGGIGLQLQWSTVAGCRSIGCRLPTRQIDVTAELSPKKLGLCNTRSLSGVVCVCQSVSQLLDRPLECQVIQAPSCRRSAWNERRDRPTSNVLKTALHQCFGATTHSARCRGLAVCGRILRIGTSSIRMRIAKLP